MATLYVNFKSSKHAPSARYKEAMTTSTTKGDSAQATEGTTTFVELFSDVAHLVHVAAAADADGGNAFYLFPSEPACVEVGSGALVSAKTLA